MYILIIVETAKIKIKNLIDDNKVMNNNFVDGIHASKTPTNVQ